MDNRYAMKEATKITLITMAAICGVILFCIGIVKLSEEHVVLTIVIVAVLFMLVCWFSIYVALKGK